MQKLKSASVSWKSLVFNTNTLVQMANTIEACRVQLIHSLYFLNNKRFRDSGFRLHAYLKILKFSNEQTRELTYVHAL